MRAGELEANVKASVKRYDDYHELWVEVSTHGDRANGIKRYVGAYKGNEKIEKVKKDEESRN